MRLIGSAPALDPPEDLIKKTMHRVIAARSIDLDVSRMHSSKRGPAFPVRLGEMIAVAAMVLIGVSLAIPVLTNTREEAMRLACQSNLSTAGRAFFQYASDNIGNMPRGLIAPNSTWYNIGHTTNDIQPVKSNSANLYLIARNRYIDPSNLVCPSYTYAAKGMTADMYDWPDAQSVSYSYQNQFAKDPLKIQNSPRMVVLADRNPRFNIANGTRQRLIYLNRKPDSAPSLNHTDHGQNVLFADGSAWWANHPVMDTGMLSSDNIWLADGVEEYNGNETPSSANDVFLVP